MTRVLAFDVGKSRCRATLFVDGVRAAEAERPGISGLAAPEGLGDALASMHAAATALSAPTHVDAVVAGLAGLARAGEDVQELGPRLAERHRADRVVLASDMTTSHAGALAGRPGVVVAGGTGSVALAVARTGATATADGWGHLLGDAGSGFSIGRRGLDAALRAHDGRGGSEVLRACAESRYGDLERLPEFVHGSANPTRAVAAFAEDVIAAARDGDEWCTSLWSDAGEELARTAAAAAARAMPEVDHVDVSVTGGLFDAGHLLNDPFAAELARLLPGSSLIPPAGDATHGCLLLATQLDLPHESLVQRLQGACA